MPATFCASPPASATLALTTRRMIKRRSPEHSRLVIIVALGGGGSRGDCVPSPAKAARPTTAPETSHCLSFPDELGNALQHGGQTQHQLAPKRVAKSPTRTVPPVSIRPSPEEHTREDRIPHNRVRRNLEGPVGAPVQRPSMPPFRLYYSLP